MYLKTYLKALLSGFNEIFELFGKVQSLIAFLLALTAVFYTANFTVYLQPIKPYYPQIIIAAAFIVLFISGYRAWIKEHKVNMERNSKKTEIKTTRAKNRIVSYATNDKIHTLGIVLTFQVSNFNEYPIQVMRFDTAAITKQFGFRKTSSSFIPSNNVFPTTIEPATVKEFHFDLAYDVRFMTLHEQLQYINDVSGKKYITKANILSIEGDEEIEVTIDFKNDDFISFVKDNSYKFNQSIIDSILKG
ncbi:hypothetical protein [Erwinia sp. PsM31]|uniref:hypothetical protein n=1 Tax=Erwinia sp. PsM31 TaxID=3030535 RepID=UPI00263B548E|nr:hypothetical protein [Erwinia sp. PsM31]MDN4628647.1 hypothetical protein [Erwinia sp. PsM31]